MNDECHKIVMSELQSSHDIAQFAANKFITQVRNEVSGQLTGTELAQIFSAHLFYRFAVIEKTRLPTASSNAEVQLKTWWRQFWPRTKDPIIRLGILQALGSALCDLDPDSLLQLRPPPGAKTFLYKPSRPETDAERLLYVLAYETYCVSILARQLPGRSGEQPVVT